MKILVSLLQFILFAVALLLSFFSFFFRADSWGEVLYACAVNCLVVGPLWAAVLLLSAPARSRNTHKRMSRMANAILVYAISASCLSAWMAFVYYSRVANATHKIENNQGRPSSDERPNPPVSDPPGR